MKLPFRNTGLQRRVVGAILLIGLVSVILGLASVYFFGRAALKETIGNTYKELAEVTARGLDKEILHHLDEARAIASNREVMRSVAESNMSYEGLTAQEIAQRLTSVEARWAGDQGVDAYLHALLTSNTTDYLKTVNQTDGDPAHLQVMVVDGRGAVVAATKKPHHYDFSRTDWWRTVMQKNTHYISGVDRSVEENTHTFSVAYPIRNGDAVIGVLHMTHNAQRFFRLVTDVRVGRTDHTMLITSDGVIQFCPLLPIGSHTISENLRGLVLRDRSGWAASADDVHYPGRTSINGYSPVSSTFTAEPHNFGGKRWYIMTSQDPREAFGPVYGLLKWVALTGILGACVIAGLGYVAARSIVRPIHALREGVERVSSGNLDHTIHIHTGDEIEDLAQAFNQMGEKLKASYSSLEAKIAERTRELESKNRELFALFSIASTLNQGGDVQRSFQDVLNKIMVTMRTDAVALTIFSGGTGGALATFAMPRNVLEGTARDVLCKLEAEVRRGEAVTVDDIRASARFNLLEKDLGYMAVTSTPVTVKGQAIGVLHFLNHEPRVYTAAERNLMESIVGQLGISIENVRLTRGGV